jgi:hypothetical protein
MPVRPAQDCRQLVDQMDQLARRAAADQLAVIDGAHARRVIAAIFHPAQTIDQTVRDFLFADDANDAAHLRVCPCFCPPCPMVGASAGVFHSGFLPA